MIESEKYRHEKAIFFDFFERFSNSLIFRRLFHLFSRMTCVYICQKCISWSWKTIVCCWHVDFWKSMAEKLFSDLLSKIQTKGWLIRKNAFRLPDLDNYICKICLYNAQSAMYFSLCVLPICLHPPANRDHKRVYDQRS